MTHPEPNELTGLLGCLCYLSLAVLMFWAFTHPEAIQAGVRAVWGG